MPLFRKVLVANRGEIAVRVIRTCRVFGIPTVVVFSEADRTSRHVREADEAVAIGPAEARLSYLSIDRVLAAAREAGADAVHPGYGFLSQNGDFADAVRDAGLVFVGPSGDVHRRMGDKKASRRLMAGAGVPVLPGYDGDEQADDRLLAEARRVGWPLMLKPSRGGGGKGMRVVRGEDGFLEALAASRREAKAAFGDDAMVLERFVERPRHVEVQVMADVDGRVVHLGERECSVQRRHQKVVEETPSPALTPGQREALCAAGVAAARAASYVNAGTVEFLLSPEGTFSFLEMNTRLQVEHPVTEAVTGLDLVRLQLEVAAGRPLALAQEDVAARRVRRAGAGPGLDARELRPHAARGATPVRLRGGGGHARSHGRGLPLARARAGDRSREPAGAGRRAPAGRHLLRTRALEPTPGCQQGARPRDRGARPPRAAQQPAARARLGAPAGDRRHRGALLIPHVGLRLAAQRDGAAGVHGQGRARSLLRRLPGLDGRAVRGDHAPVHRRHPPALRARPGAVRRAHDDGAVARYLAAVGEATDVPPRSPGRGPPYWKSRVLRRQALGDEDDGQGRWVQETA